MIEWLQCNGWSLIHPFFFFFLRNMKHFEIIRQRHLYTPFARFSPKPNATSHELSAELWPLDPMISDNDKNDLPPTLGEDRLPPKTEDVQTVDTSRD